MLRRLAPAALLLAPAPALAHHAMGGETPSSLWQGLASGLAHPVLGPDHLAFIVGVGLLAALTGLGPLLPVAAIAALACGAAAHAAGFAWPGAEALVALSVVLAGLAVLLPARTWGERASGGRLAGSAGAFLVAAALLHGYAQGESIVGAEPTPVLAYLAGLATSGAALSLGVYALARRPLPALLPRLAGAGIVLVGAAAALA